MFRHETFPKLRLIAAAMLLLCAAQGVVTAQTPAPAAQNANDLFQAKKWPEAAQAYEAIVKADPNNGMAWFRYGISLHSMKKYEGAAAAFEHAAAILKGPIAMYNAATAYARMNNQAKAFEWLKKAADAGFSSPPQLSSDEDLASLRGDARFAEITKKVNANADPCGNRPEYRQFDFWVGEWDVKGPASVQQGAPPASSSIQNIIGRCVVLENFSQGPYSGKSFNYFDSAINKWREDWVDSAGGSISYTGEYKDNAMHFEGESHTPSGRIVKVRLTFFNLGAGKVRQFAESTTDDGKTWNVSYDLMYTRKK
jgi:tetratricopeptide (TPR) repeat protein